MMRFVVMLSLALGAGCTSSADTSSSEAGSSLRVELDGRNVVLSATPEASILSESIAVYVEEDGVSVFLTIPRDLVSEATVDVGTAPAVQASLAIGGGAEGPLAATRGTIHIQAAELKPGGMLQLSLDDVGRDTDSSGAAAAVEGWAHATFATGD